MNNLVRSCLSLAETFQQVSSRDLGFRKGPWAPPAACVSCWTSDGSSLYQFFPRVCSLFNRNLKCSSLYEVQLSIMQSSMFPQRNQCAYHGDGGLGKMCLINPVRVYNLKIQDDDTNSKLLLPIWISPSLHFYPFGEVIFSWGRPVSYICGRIPISFLSCWCRWAALRCPDIQPAQSFFTWQSRPWLHFQGLKRSQNISCGFSIADGAQSHSWRRYT